MAEWTRIVCVIALVGEKMEHVLQVLVIAGELTFL